MNRALSTTDILRACRPPDWVRPLISPLFA